MCVCMCVCVCIVVGLCAPTVLFGSFTDTALMYSSTESLIGHLRGQEDTLNSVAAATIAGVLYKSTGMLP